MSKVDPRLTALLIKKLDISGRQVNNLISAKAAELFVPRQEAALAVAAERGINAHRFATPEALQTIRHAKAGGPPPLRISTIPPADRPTRAAARPPQKKKARRRGTSVFVVHGRDENLRRALFSFLRSAGLDPIEWRKAIELTKKPSPHVSEILDAAFREAVAVVVLLSPDDEAQLKKEFLRPKDPAAERALTGQARPNVLFEAGMAFGRHPDATVLVQVGDVKAFSDIAGRHIAHLSNDPESRKEFLTKLANAGCNVDTSGTDWLKEGNFELPGR